MKKIIALLFIVVLLYFTGCEDKKYDLPVEETIVTIEDKNTTLEDANASPLKTDANTTKFTLNDIDNKSHTFYFNKKDIFIDNVPQKFVLLNFFATWCPPCNGQLPYISDIETKYKERLFVAGILVNDSEKEYHEIEALTARYTIDYFISNSKQNDTFATELLKCLNIAENFQLPLTILYKNGKYYTHYEGAVPIEMIEYDLNNAMKHKE